ncbi:MAG: GldG family protein [Clostridia bacterium]|nr:GldG family protein [Clostridia bacterium]
MEQNQNKKTLQRGALGTVSAAVVIVIAIVINLIVAELPATFTSLDTSPLNLYTIGEQTEQILAGVDTAVDIYLIATSGYENATLMELLARYEAKCANITVKTIDPVTNPAFTMQYTEEDLEENSLIVVSELRHTIVPYEDIYVQTFSDEDIQNYINYGIVNYSTAFAGEAAITTAVDYVTTSDLPVIYTLTGHSEVTLSETMAGYVSAKNMDMVDLSLVASGAVPQDASMVLIISPKTDITEAELTVLSDYLTAGGKILLFTDFTGSTQPNLDALAAKMGMTRANGLVIENSSSNYYPGYPHYLLPAIGSHTITAPLAENKMYVLMPVTHGILETEHDAGITVTGLLTTSKSAIAKTNVEFQTVQKEEGDLEGPFMVGAAAENASGGQLVWYSSSNMLVDDMDSVVSGGNSTLFLNTLSALTGKTNTISINSIDLSTDPLVVSDLASTIWTALLCVILPLAIVVAGFLYWNKRRRA